MTSTFLDLDDFVETKSAITDNVACEQSIKCEAHGGLVAVSNESSMTGASDLCINSWIKKWADCARESTIKANGEASLRAKYRFSNTIEFWEDMFMVKIPRKRDYTS